MKKNKIWFSIGILVVVVALLVSGCNKVKQEKQENVIKIGAVLPMTGAGSLIGEYYRDSAELAVDDINANGGINGKMLKLVVEDGKTNPEASSSAALSLINTKGVNVLFTGFRGPSLAIASVANSNKKILFANTADTVSKKAMGQEYFFPAGVEILLQAKVIANYAKEHGCKKAVFIHENVDITYQMANNIKEIYKDNITTEVIQFGETDFRTVLTKIKSTNPECVLVVIQSKSFLNMLQQMEEFGMDYPIYTTAYSVNPTVIQQAPKDQLNRITYISEGLYEKSNEKTEEFFSNYREKYGKDPHVFGAIMYDLVHIAAEGMKACDNEGKGADNPECLKQETPKIGVYNGITGKYIITETHDIPLVSSVFWKIENRKNEFIKIVEEPLS